MRERTHLCVCKKTDTRTINVSTNPPQRHTAAAGGPTKAPTATTQHRPPAIGLPSPSANSAANIPEPPTPAGFYKTDSTVFDIDLVEGMCVG